MNGISLINFEPLPSVAFGGSTGVHKFSAASDSVPTKINSLLAGPNNAIPIWV